MAVCIAILAGLVVLALLRKPFFREFETFRDWLDYAFGPGLFGAAMESLGAWAPPAMAGALQIAAAAVLVAGRRHR